MSDNRLTDSQEEKTTPVDGVVVLDSDDIASAAAGTQAAKDAREAQLGAEGPEGHRRGGPGGGPHGGGGAVNREVIAQMAPTLKRVLAFARQYWGYMITAVVMAVAGSVLTIVSPHFIGEITDEIAKGITGSVDMSRVTRLVVASQVTALAPFSQNWKVDLCSLSGHAQPGQSKPSG